MQVLIMANGEYGDLEWYRGRGTSFDMIICADGGTAWARRLGLKPDRVMGDLDSVTPEDLEYIRRCSSAVDRYPSAKDDTDTQLALKWVLEQKPREAVIWGGLGGRLDHTLSNLHSASVLTKAGIQVVFEQPGLNVYLVSERLVLKGAEGHTVSLIVLGDKASGVTLTGFQYPLDNAELVSGWQYAISNVVLEKEACISLRSGILAVFDYAGPV